jgi:hypothetical protein
MFGVFRFDLAYSSYKTDKQTPFAAAQSHLWFSVILFYGGVYVPTDKRTNCARHSGFTDPAGSLMDILNNIDQDDVDVRELAEKVSRDLALTAKTLRFANSAYYTTMVKVTTIDQAISLLGLHQVRQIIISAALTGCFPENNCPGFSHLQFWRHSIWWRLLHACWQST